MQFQLLAAFLIASTYALPSQSNEIVGRSVEHNVKVLGDKMKEDFEKVGHEIENIAKNSGRKIEKAWKDFEHSAKNTGNSIKKAFD